MDEVNQELTNQSKSPASKTGKVTEFSPASKSHKFLITGLIVLLLLTAVSAAYMFSQNQSFRSQLGLPSFKFLRSHKTCTYNDQTYQSGEGFQSIDGCNSCSCSETGEVTCTAMACLSDVELIETDQEADWVTYQGQGFSYKYPSTLTQLEDPRGVSVYSDMKYYFANEAMAVEYLNCLDQGKTQLEQYRQNPETVMEMVDWEGGCDAGRVVYQISVGSERSDNREPLSQKFINQAPDIAIKVSEFNDTLGRSWFVEDVVWGMADRVDVYSETTIGEQYYQIRILTNSRALSKFLGKEMMIQDGDAFDASPTIEHLALFNKQILSTFEFTN